MTSHARYAVVPTLVLALLCPAVVAPWVCSAGAEPVRFVFSGEVIATNKPGIFPIGLNVTGQYTFESTTPDFNPFNMEQGDYDGALINYSFAAGAYAALADESNAANDGGTIDVNRNSVFDEHQYSVFAQRVAGFSAPWGPDVGGEELVRMWLRLIDDNGTAITSIALPLTPPDLNDFTSNTFGLIFELDPTGDPGVVFELHALELAPVVHAKLDIRPGACPNPFNGRAQGVLPVALVGTEDFDVNDVDAASLRLEGVAPIHLSYEDVATPFAGDLCGCTEAGSDGRTDLMLKFSTQDIVAAVGPLLRRDRLTLMLTGRMFDGTLIEAEDCVVGVGRIEPEPAVTELRLSAGSTSGSHQRVEFVLPTHSEFTLVVFDVAGRVVRHLAQTTTEAGLHELSWDASRLSDGVYFYRLRAGTLETAARFVLMR